MTLTTRTATGQDVDHLSHVLARAFREDPFHRWIFPSERAWTRSSHRSFALALEGEVENGTVFTDDGMQGAAIWRAPGLGAPSLWEKLRIAVPTIGLVGVRSPFVLCGFQRLMASHPREAHWYLNVLGTDPTYQNKGVGSALMRVVLDRCDTDGSVAYLEASRPENVPYYESHGFEILGELRMPKGPTVWRMLYSPPAVKRMT